MRYFSETGLAKYLDEEIFEKQESGFFVDIGAFDGLTNNHTLFFEKYRKWEGICIDANESAVTELAKNRRSKIIEACINESADSLWLESGRFSGLLAHYDSSRATPEHPFLYRDSISSMTGRSLTEILVAEERTEVDLCIINVMGSEIAVLNSIDMQKIDISIIVLSSSNEASDFIPTWMKRKGYQLIKIAAQEQVYIKHQQR
ncbi:Methyltransferase FkbM domain-containing protein [Pedobacter steynii]|uniref:Methyltransferase FkbM domain-containing protein n=1 Tax=Pedobacter steynii TaxID=430522 RepID=A0A1G9UP41_9SPHI|nr:FkbM family methyltransferase [Pedobacter steynii]NQX40829.1 FkbM family methyltransferase [Pedobacter steynii]SDM61670.1 Methyltransferase FkbM domain-containing protein [Pedobacter steynii]